jgi:hypothetical protein
MPATGARVEMTTQCGGTTAPNGPQHLDVLPAEPVAISFQESSARAADEIGHLQGRPAQLLLLWGPLLQLRRVQRTRCRLEMACRKM